MTEGRGGGLDLPDYGKQAMTVDALFRLLPKKSEREVEGNRRPWLSGGYATINMLRLIFFLNVKELF